MMNDTKQITIAGFGGQGVMLLGQMLAHMGNETNLYSLWYPSYGPETRGGTANCAVTLSQKPINSPVFSKATTVIALNKPSLDKFINRVCDDGVIFYNSSLIKEDIFHDKAKVYAIPVNDLAISLGNLRVANMVMLGAYLALNDDFSDQTVENVLRKILGESKKDLVAINLLAIAEGKKYITEYED